MTPSVALCRESVFQVSWLPLHIRCRGGPILREKRSALITT